MDKRLGGRHLLGGDNAKVTAEIQFTLYDVFSLAVADKMTSFVILKGKILLTCL